MVTKRYIEIGNCDPPHAISDPNKVIAIAEDMLNRGWIGPALVGYWIGPRFQLLSGTHRLAAAKLAGLGTIPTVSVTRQSVVDAFGDLKAWKKIMESGDGPIV